MAWRVFLSDAVRRFDFCEPGEELGATLAPHEGDKIHENLGQILLGERIRTSPYQV